ncbi:MAG: MFS transporter [Ignavibacteria bacterium]
MFNRKAIAFVIQVLLFSIIWGALEFILPIRLSEAKLSIETCSLLLAISSGVSILLNIPAGKLSDKIGREKLIILSMIVISVAFLILSLFETLSSFIVSIVLIGIAYGLNWSPFLAYVGDRVNHDNPGKIFGGFTSIDAIGESIAPLIISSAIIFSNLNYISIYLAFTSLLCAIIFQVFKNNQTHSKNDKVHFKKILSFKTSMELIIRTSPSSILLLFIGLFSALFWQSVWFSQPLIGYYENSLFDSAIIICISSLPAIILSPLIGKLIDEFNVKKIFYCSIVLAMISLLSFYFNEHLIYKIGLILIASTGVLGTKLVSNVLVVKLKPQEKGELFGIIEVIRDFGFIITPIIIGYTYKIIGLSGIYLIDSFIAFLLLATGIYTFKRLKITQ